MPLELDNCIFNNNYTDTRGGAVQTSSGALRITNCLFRDNVANLGGAVSVSSGALDLEYCTFSGNSAAEGGAVYVRWTYEVSVSNCTFAYNQAPQGSGLSVVTPYTNPLEIVDSIITFGLDGEGLYWDGADTLDVVHCDIFGNAGGDWFGNIARQAGQNGNINLDPWFCDGPAGDFTLMESSPCLASNDPGGIQIGAHGQGCQNPAGMEGGTPSVAGAILLPNHPNPFNPRTTISFRLTEAGPVTVGLYDMTGRAVVTLAAGRYGPGTHAVDWSGLDAGGRAVSSGTYLVVLRSEDLVASRKISLLR